MIRQSQGNIAQDELDSYFGSFGSCFLSGAGDAWTSELPRLRWGAEVRDGDEGLFGTARIARIDGAGRVVRSSGDEIRRVGGASDLALVTGAYDLDGDGASEAFVTRSTGDFEGEGESWVEVYTARGGRVTPYAPASVVGRVERVVDRDEDGRPDLLDTDEFSLDSSTEDGARLSGLLRLAHGLPDGTFSLDDSAARDFVREQCEAPPDRLVDVYESGGGVDREATFRAILCARVYGEGPERLVQRLWLEGRTHEDDDKDWLRDASRAALWRLPFTLTAPPRAAASAGGAAGVQARADAGVRP